MSFWVIDKLEFKGDDLNWIYVEFCILAVFSSIFTIFQLKCYFIFWVLYLSFIKFLISSLFLLQYYWWLILLDVQLLFLLYLFRAESNPKSGLSNKRFSIHRKNRGAIHFLLPYLLLQFSNHWEELTFDEEDCFS